MAEKWRDIAGYDGVYQVSDLGQVRNTQTLKILHPTKLKNGRFYITLSSDGFQKKCNRTQLGRRGIPRGVPCWARDQAQRWRLHPQRIDQPGVHHAAGESEAVRDDNRWVFGEPHKACTNRKRTTVLPMVESANGRVKPDQVLVNGRREKHAEGASYLEWREKGRRVRLSVGKDAQEASARRQRKQAELNAVESGVSLLPENGVGQRSGAAAVASFLEEKELTKKPKTLAAYTTALNYFKESCRKLCLHEIERYALLEFVGFLRDEKKNILFSIMKNFGANEQRPEFFRSSLGPGALSCRMLRTPTISLAT